MCGLLGEFMFNNSDKIPSVKFEELLVLSKHRGPDATAVISNSNFQLGFNRLSILDVTAKGNQPMISPSKRYFLMCNGEIYNFKELVEQYDLKNLRSTSDTEVIVQLIDILGVEQTIKSLDGMFSIVIVDTIENKLFLSRDFAGIKPLFYGTQKKGVVFASQFNQVFKHPLFKNQLKLRKEIVKEYFGFGYMQAPNTIYKDIYQVQPGELIEITSSGQITKKTISQFSKEFIGQINSIENYETELKKSVKDQLISDVPLATFLSGGIDSPLIAGIAKSYKNDMESFTLGVDDAKLDETAAAKRIAKELDIKHGIETVESDLILNNVNTHFKYLSEPFGDYSSIPTYVIAKAARKKYTVMLSGDGGDELFFGYPRMQDVLIKKDWFKIPYRFRKPLIRILNKIGLLNSWAAYSNKTFKDFVQSKHLHVSKVKLDAIIPDSSFSKELEFLYSSSEQVSKEGLLHWLRWNEFYAHMQRVLIKVDRMSMANSLEVRVPFLGKKSILEAWKYIPNLNGTKFILKDVLKQCLARYIPNSLVEKNKKGFAVPIEDWLRNELREDVEKVVFETPIYARELLESDNLKEYVSDFIEGKHNEFWGVWQVYAWQKWALAEGLI